MQLTATRPVTRVETATVTRYIPLLVALALLGISLLLLRGWLGPGVPLTPRREMLAQLAWAGLAADALRAGHLPAEWSPWFLGGQPWTRLLSVPVYLLVGLLSLLPGVGLAGAAKLFTLAVFTLSGATMYAWVRSLRVGTGPALVAAAAYQFFPFHAQASADWWEHLLVWALLPLPLWLVERWRWTWTWRRASPLGVALGLLVLANPERAPHNAFFLGLYLLARELPGWCAGRAVAWRNACALALAGIVALAVAAPILVSTLISLPLLGASEMRGPASTLDSHFLRDWSLTPELLLTALLRRAKFDPPTDNLPAIWKSFGGLNAWYLGTVLVALALCTLPPWRRSPPKATNRPAPPASRTSLLVSLSRSRPASTSLLSLLWLLVVLALLIGMSPWLPGDPFHYLFARILPYRAIFYLGLFLPPLAALGLERIKNLRFWRFSRASNIQSTREASHSLISKLIPLVALILILLDFSPVSAGYTTAPAYFTADELAAYRWLAEQQASGPRRVWEPTDHITAKYQRTLAVTVAPVLRFDGHWDEGVPLPLRQRYHAAPSLLDAALLDDLAVHYIMLRDDEPGAEHWQQEVAALGFNQLAWQQGVVQIWHKPSAAPYIQAAGHVELLAYQPGLIRLQLENDHNQTVTLAEAWYPDWTLTIDGVPAPLKPSDAGLLSVAIPAGRHDILFAWHTPRVIQVAWLLCLTTIAILLLVAAQQSGFHRENQGR
jgi:hypothetical protein